MKRIALVCSEGIRPAMGGIGIRYLELARRLPRYGFNVTLFSPADPGQAAALDLPAGALRRFERGRLAALLAGCDVTIAQGPYANDVIREAPHVPLVVDLYDPWLVENLHYAEALGTAPFSNDHASWTLQGAHGDFFLCASETQRTFYLGLLTALGRVNPRSIEADADLRRLIDVVPFGVPMPPPSYRPYLPDERPRPRRLLFGGVYDWYDPWTLLNAVGDLPEVDWTLLFVHNPNPETTPQVVLEAVEARCRAEERLRRRVQFIDWAPAVRRFDLLRDVDVLISLHRPGLETRLAMRTRFLEALAVGCPVIATAGGEVSDLLEQEQAGWVVPPEDPQAVKAALTTVLAGGPEVARRQANGRALAARFVWDRVLEPLVRFCHAPRRDPFKRIFDAAPGGSGAPDRWVQRLRRLRFRLKQLVS